MSLQPILFCLCTGLLFSNALPAETPAEATAADAPAPVTEAVVRPMQERAKMNSSRFTEEFDKIDIQMWKVESDSIGFKMLVPEELVQINCAPHESIAFTSVEAQDVRIEMTLFSVDEFIPDLSDNSIQAYIEGRRLALAPKEFELLNPGNFWADRGLHIAGTQWKQVHYSASEPAANPDAQATAPKVTTFHDILFFVDDTFVLISVYGPKNQVNYTAKNIVQHFNDAIPFDKQGELASR